MDDNVAQVVGQEAPAPLRPIVLQNHKREKFAFQPQSDVTPIEAALLIQLFVKLIMHTSNRDPLPDWPGYLDDHRLWRHFVQI